MRIKAVLFDLDGTLVDSNGLHVRAWEEAFGESGHAVSADDIRGQIGKGADKLVPTLIPGADDDTVELLGDRHGAIFKAKYIERVRPFAHARDLMVRVRDSGRRVVLASSASQEELDHYIGLLDAGGIVAAATSIDDVDESKPAPDIFGAALAKLGGLDAGSAVVIGDSPYDIAAAADCGIKTVALRSGGFPDTALAGAVALYDDAGALLEGFATSPLAR